jgi:hypothetical protein
VSINETFANVTAAKSIPSATVIAAASKGAGGEPGSSENKGNCKNGDGLAQHDDPRWDAPASGSIQYPLSIGCPRASLRSTFGIYERALVTACPILLLFARHCGIGRTKGRRSSLALFARRKSVATRKLSQTADDGSGTA